MAQEFAAAFYNSRTWRKCREAFFKAKYGLCERCAGPGKIVHHVKYITPQNINDPAITLNHENLELLCQECHNKEHHERYSPIGAGLMFDENGDLIRSGWID